MRTLIIPISNQLINVIVILCNEIIIPSISAGCSVIYKIKSVVFVLTEISIY